MLKLIQVDEKQMTLICSLLSKALNHSCSLDILTSGKITNLWFVLFASVFFQYIHSFLHSYEKAFVTIILKNIELLLVILAK